MQEQELIQQLKQGSEAAFKTFVESHQDRVFNTALGIVQNAADAEDVAQEVFIQAFRSIGSFKGESKLSTWLYRIATTRSLDLLRSKKSKKRFGFLQRLFNDQGDLLYDPPEFHHPGIALEQKENAAKLFKAIAKLPENQKAAFTLHKLEGVNYQEISEILDTTVSSVEMLMYRAKLNLRKILEADGSNNKD
ncbi:MAG TPA: RNA polymerase sigma factor [Chitinophagaceae bacterium]|nr:RNA polymerase sigma factor [Chitinophagaceae bacterium]